MRLIIVLPILLVSIGCSHSIRRYGYEKDRNAEIVESCRINFFRGMPTDTAAYQVVGKIKIGDTGFSTKCHENDAIRILKKEACLLGADAVNITDEKRSDLWSTCYRAEAEFLKEKSQGQIHEVENITVVGAVDPINYQHDTDSTSIESRVKGDKSRNMVIRWSSLAVGFLAGFLLTWSP